jgi:HPt (histidine-containing phosphotransfer) domain-containing protein
VPVLLRSFIQFRIGTAAPIHDIVIPTSPHSALSRGADAPADVTQVRSAPTTIGRRLDDAFQPDSPLDRAGIEQLKVDLGGAEILGELVELFGSKTPELLVQLHRGVEAGDTVAVSRIAHQLKGGCLTLAANRMAELCDELQDSSRAGSLTGADALVQSIEVAFEQAYAALRREVS